MRSRVAVENTDDSCLPRFGNHRTRVIFGIPGMHDYRLIQLACKRELFRECASLLLTR